MPKARSQHFTHEDNWHFFAERLTQERQAFHGERVELGAVTLQPADHEGWAVQASWDGTETSRVTLRNGERINPYLDIYANQGAVVMDVRVFEAPTKTVQAGIYTGPLTPSFVDITNQLQKLPQDRWQSISIDLRCFTRDRADMSKVTVPLLLQTEGRMRLALAKVRYQPNLADQATISCGKQ